MAAPGSPFLSQIQRLEEKLRAAQQVTSVSFLDDEEDMVAAAAEQATGSGGSPSRQQQATEAAIAEAAKLRQHMQHGIIARAEAQARENEGLASKVHGLDLSLRESEAMRKREGAQRELDMAEMAEMQKQHARELELERRRRNFDVHLARASTTPGAAGGSLTTPRPAIQHVSSAGLTPAASAMTPTANAAAQWRGLASAAAAEPLDVRAGEREWALRAELAEVTHEAHAARQAAQTIQEEHERRSAELTSRAASATQGVLQLQAEVKASLEERAKLLQDLAEAKAEKEAAEHEAEKAVADKAGAVVSAAEDRAACLAATNEAEKSRKACAVATVAAEEARTAAAPSMAAAAPSDAHRRAL